MLAIFRLIKKHNNRHIKVYTPKVAKNYKNQIIRRKYKRLYIFFNTFVKNFKKISIILVLLAFSFTAYFFLSSYIRNLHQNQYEFFIFADSQELSKKLYEYIISNKSTFNGLDKLNMIEIISTNFNISKEAIYLWKFGINKIFIDIIELSPDLSIFHLDKVLLVDKNLKVIKQIEALSSLSLSHEDILLLKDLIEPNDEFIKSKYIADVANQTTVKNIKWETVKIEDKIKMLHKEKSRVIDKINTHYIQNRKILIDKNLENIPVLISAVGIEKINNNIFNFINTLENVFESRNINLDMMILLDDLSIQVKSGQKLFLFSQKRSIEDQIVDFDSLIYNNILARYNFFDLRSKVIVTK
ncbi:MAG: hypothetical protein NZZ41_01405 [Candidatus Dojkabacteria bacterium]|nr:hypothetical protein [Candidatus Dojkabacteria bacterium]